MRVFITGATGMVGRALVLRLRREGHQPVAWVRSLARGRSLLGQEAELITMGAPDAALDAALARCGAVVNLAGENILVGRWTARRKAALVASRVALTERLVAALSRLEARPRVLVSASAVGIYAHGAAAPCAEGGPAGTGFLADLCRAWERAAEAARPLGVRVALARIGIVLGLEGGALAATLPAFAAGVGGCVGPKRAAFPWIHLHDLVEALLFAITHEGATGAFNAVAPGPADARAYARALARACRTWPWLPVPAWALRLALGEAAGAVLCDCPAVPRQLLAWGFRFAHPELEPAVRHLVVGPPLALGPVKRPAAGAAPPDPYVRARRPTRRLAAEVVLGRPRPEVFAFFCRAENLGLMTPLAMAMQIEGRVPEPMQAGAEINYRLRLGPLPLRWRTRIARWQAPELFVDAQVRGPYRAWWHEHRFDSEGEHTRMRDQVDYAIGWGPLGALAHRLFVGRQLRLIFTHRAHAIELRFGASAGPAPQPALRP